MLEIGLRTSLTNFLDDVCHLFRYGVDDPELDVYIRLWEMMERSEFCDTLVKLMNIEILYDDADDDMLLKRNDEVFKLEPEMRKYNRDNSLDYDIHTEEFLDFAYVFLDHIQQWVHEIQGEGRLIKGLNRIGDRINVIIS